MARDLEELLRTSQEKLGRPTTWQRRRDYFSRLPWFNILSICSGISCVALLVIFALAIKEDQRDRKRLFNECMADGRKEYECKAIGRPSAPPFIFMPMPIVVH